MVPRGRCKGFCTVSRASRMQTFCSNFNCMQPPLHCTTSIWLPHDATSTLHHFHDTALHYTKLYSTSLHSTPLHSTPLHSTNCNYTSKSTNAPLHCTPRHYTPLHFTALHSLHHTTAPTSTRITSAPADHRISPDYNALGYTIVH